MLWNIFSHFNGNLYWVLCVLVYIAGHFLSTTLSHVTWQHSQPLTPNLLHRGCYMSVATMYVSLETRWEYHCNMASVCTMNMLNTDPTKTAITWDKRNRCHTLFLFNDKAWLHLNGHTNSQSNRQWWSAENLLLIHKLRTHAIMVAAWCAMSAVGEVSLFFIYDTILHTFNNFISCLIMRTPMSFISQQFNMLFKLEFFWWQ